MQLTKENLYNELQKYIEEQMIKYHYIINNTDEFKIFSETFYHIKNKLNNKYYVG